ncbi:MAG TPA: DUF5703 domain-containing protein [Verrucomicrobiae bacterium]|nr:DUF5703 domain-containing protein [Verrucomicrobiae bacterium]
MRAEMSGCGGCGRVLGWVLMLTPLLRADGAAAAERFDPIAELGKYDVVWDSPSRDWNGTMPIGNGEIGVNAWWEEGGDLRLLIARTDAWDEWGRLVKVGMVRVGLRPNPVGEGKTFHQALRLSEGMIQFVLDGGRVEVRLWVDAHRPMIHVEISGDEAVEAGAAIECWRKEPRVIRYVGKAYFGDPAYRRPDASEIISLPDTMLSARSLPGEGRIGWLHDNGVTDCYEQCARLQGLEGFEGKDPLENRVFGGVIASAGARRQDDATLASPPGRSHRFDIAVATRQPSTAEGWVESATGILREAERQPLEQRRIEHVRWWREFWGRSWIFVSGALDIPQVAIIPANAHPLRVGSDQAGGNRFPGEIGRVSLFPRALGEAELASLVARGRDGPAPPEMGAVASATGPCDGVAGADGLRRSPAISIEAWVRVAPGDVRGGRIVDQIQPGGGDGLLFDTHPGKGLRLIIGRRILTAPVVLPAGRWAHVAASADAADGRWGLFVNGAEVAADGSPPSGEEAAVAVTRGYILQRWMNACAGRGALPIKFNGSLFTVPTGDAPETWRNDPDYRRWGSGYWWQNTRLPYISACAAGDFDLMLPMFRMYAGATLDIARYRNRHHLKQPGASLNECSYFWGHAFNECYGFERRPDLPPGINENQYHRWEFTAGYEVAWMMLDYYEHTRDEKFLAETVLPFVREILAFYDARYPVDAGGRIVIHPAQALETWWDCTNPMPDIAGLTAVTGRLLRLTGPEAMSPMARLLRCLGRKPSGTLPPDLEALVRRLAVKLPPLPTREQDGARMLAAAERFESKKNIENPELYAVFPFRLIAVGSPDIDLGIRAFHARTDRGDIGWRQDDIFAAYLGLADDAAKLLVGRARKRHAASRFPSFWGPNYDWVPDQDHGGVLMRALQAMLMQTDGRAIHLLPAWPRGWDAHFKLHAPDRTTAEGRVEGGRVPEINVSPSFRQADVSLKGK